MSDRKHYFDFLRGVAILMVIGIHTFDPIKGRVEGFDIGVLVRQCLNVAVPLFLALSGFFLYRKPLDTKEKVFSFWKKQIPKNYIPVLFWSMPLFALDLMGGKNIGISVLKLVICGYSVYYFVALIIQYYLLLPVFQRLRLNRGVIVALSSVSIIIVTYINIVRGMNLPLVLYAGCFVLWIAFYYLGCSLSVSARGYSLWYPIVITTTGLVLSYIESIFLVTNYGSGYGIKLSSFIYSFGCILLLMSYKIDNLYRSRKIGKVVEWIGRNSFVIYLFHCYIVISLGKVPVELPWIVRWAVVVLLSLVVAQALKSIPIRIRYYLGSYD